MKRCLRFLMLVLLGIGISGCIDFLTYSTLPDRQPETGKTMTVSYRFEDIPVPSGLTLNRKDSFIYETKDIKTGLLVYEGKGEMDKLVSFFKQQMPNYRWRLISNFELHHVMLTFVKEGWISNIYLLTLEQDRKRVEIRIGPVDLKL